MAHTCVHYNQDTRYKVYSMIAKSAWNGQTHVTHWANGLKFGTCVHHGMPHKATSGVWSFEGKKCMVLQLYMFSGFFLAKEVPSIICKTIATTSSRIAHLMGTPDVCPHQCETYLAVPYRIRSVALTKFDRATTNSRKIKKMWNLGLVTFFHA